MTDELTHYFGRFRRSPFDPQNLVDPNMVAHELIDIGSGNAGPTGWYDGHAYSSNVGQTNLLNDPQMVSCRGWSPGNSLTTSFQWLSVSITPAEYQAKIGGNATAIYGNFGANAFWRGVGGMQGKNPFNSDANEIEFGCGSNNLGLNVEFDLQTDMVAIGPQFPKLDYVIASFRLANIFSGIDWIGWGSMTAYVEIIDAQHNVTLSSTAYDLLALFPDGGVAGGMVNREVTLWTATASPAGGVDLATQLRIVGVPNTTSSPDTFQLFVGEPSLHFNYNPNPLPFAPDIGQWRPNEIWGVNSANTEPLITSWIRSNPTTIAFQVHADGTMIWAPGNSSGASDTQLWRRSGRLLQLDNGGGAGASLVIAPDIQTGIAASSTINHVSNTEMISSGGIVTMTSTPTIADGTDGQVIRLVNVGSFTITLQDQGTLANSNLRLEAATIALAPRNSVELMYSVTVGDWIQVGKVCQVL